MLPLDLPHDELIGELQGQVRGDNTRRLLVGALQAASRQRPLLIVVEDAHWCDSASWALARLVAQRIPTALLVLALRPLENPSRRTTSGSARRPMPSSFASIPCRLMTSPRSSGSGSGSPVPRPVAELIGEHAGGNPFFSEELAYALRDTGVITITNGSCRIAPGADLQELSLPDTVQGVVLARIDRLAPPQQLTLKVASVIGRSFAYRLLHDVYPIAADRPTLAGQLESLQQRSLVLPETPEQELAWMFKHVITRDVAYELMVRAQRRALHQAIAEWYEQHHAAQLPGFYPLLAYHWSRTDETAKAVRFQGLAGERALASGAYREAVLFLTAALERDPPPSKDGGEAAQFRRAGWERQLAEAHLGLGNTGEGGSTSAGRWSCSGRHCPTRIASLACCDSSPSRHPPCLPDQAVGRGDGRQRRAWRPAAPTCASPRSSGSPTTSPPWSTPASGRSTRPSRRARRPSWPAPIPSCAWRPAASPSTHWRRRTPDGPSRPPAAPASCGPWAMCALSPACT